jgi:hypothetical protein
MNPIPSEVFLRPWTVPKDRNRPEQNNDAARIELLPTANGAGVWLILSHGRAVSSISPPLTTLEVKVHKQTAFPD